MVEWINKLEYIPTVEYYSEKKNEWTTIILNNMSELHKLKVEQKEADTKEDILHDFIYKDSKTGRHLCCQKTR